MVKIRKNLSDEEMMKGFEEEISFENLVEGSEPAKTSTRPGRKDAAPPNENSFFTPELQEQVSRALLELKVKLYREGIVDYKLKVSREGNQVMLTAVPAGGNKKKEH